MDLETNQQQDDSVRRAARWSKFLHRVSACTWYALLVLCLFFLASGRTSAQTKRVEFIEGFSQPHRISKVAAAGSGIVQSINAIEGMSVSRGQCLVQLDDAVHTKLLEAAKLGTELQGELKAAEAQLESAQQRAAIIQQLAKQGSATPEELLRAENDSALAQANLLTTKEQMLLRKADTSGATKGVIEADGEVEVEA